MCSHSNCPDWQRTVTNPVAIYVLWAMTKVSTICCLLRLAPWYWRIFLHAVVVPMVFALDFSGVPLYYSTISFTSYNRWIECLVCCQDNRTWTPVAFESWMDLYAYLVTLTGCTKALKSQSSEVIVRHLPGHDESNSALEWRTQYRWQIARWLSGMHEVFWGGHCHHHV